MKCTQGIVLHIATGPKKPVAILFVQREMSPVDVV